MALALQPFDDNAAIGRLHHAVHDIPPAIDRQPAKRGHVRLSNRESYRSAKAEHRVHDRVVGCHRWVNGGRPVGGSRPTILKCIACFSLLRLQQIYSKISPRGCNVCTRHSNGYLGAHPPLPFQKRPSAFATLWSSRPLTSQWPRSMRCECGNFANVWCPRRDELTLSWLG